MKVTEVLSVLIPGVPIPQGSKTVFMVKGRPVLADANSAKLKPWRKTVSQLAELEWSGRQKLEGPVAVLIEFRLERPKTVRREFPSVKPDVDKLQRSILDALTSAGVWGDDSQVVHLTGSKVYAVTAGAFVRVGVIEREGD